MLRAGPLAFGERADPNAGRCRRRHSQRGPVCGLPQVRARRLWAWAALWVQHIGQLSALHRTRRLWMGDPTSAAFSQSDARLRDHVALLQQHRNEQLVDVQLAAPARKVLKVMTSYWVGLTVFIEHPWLDLDNNAAERALRPAVVGRKKLLRQRQSVVRPTGGQRAERARGSMRRWGVNPRTWLKDYLQACAHAGGKPPPDIDAFISWRTTPARQAAMRQSGVITASTSTAQDTS